MEELTEGFTVVTLVKMDKSPDPQMEWLRTPRASGDEDLALWCNVRTECSTRCGYEDVPSSPPVKEVPGIRPDRAPDKLSSPGAVPEGCCMLGQAERQTSHQTEELQTAA